MVNYSSKLHKTKKTPLNLNHYIFDIWNPGRRLGQALNVAVLDLLQYKYLSCFLYNNDLD